MPSTVPSSASSAAATPSLMPRVLSAAAGSLLTAVLVTPLDVVKTRLQAPSVSSSLPAGATTWTALTHLVRTEGVTALWSGLSPTLVMAVPSTAMYFTFYDTLKESMQTALDGAPALQALTPLFAGGLARFGAATIISPLELVRTKMQAAAATNATSIGTVLRSELRGNGVLELWRGLGATLLRDVPFSMLYWMGYEQLTSSPALRACAHALAPGDVGQSFALAFLGGAGSGSIAAFTTTPFDVVKTRRQAWSESAVAPASCMRPSVCVSSCTCPPAITASARVSTWNVIATIAREEGVAALFAGVGPRVAKVAPACAIMISCFEVGKKLLSS